MSERINGKLLRRALAVARERGETDWGVSEEIFQMWKGNSGNAKARRRWRRRDLPNTQFQPVRTGQCRMCLALQSEQTNERSYCAEHAADAVRMWNAIAANGEGK